MQDQNDVKKHHFYFSYLVGSSDEMRNHGARVVRFCLLRQATHSLCYYGKLFSVKTGHKNLVYLANSSIPKLESPPFRVPFPHPAHPGHAKRYGGRTHQSHESFERGNSRSKHHMFIEAISLVFFGWMMIVEIPGDELTRKELKGQNTLVKLENVVSLQDTTILSLGIWARTAL